MKYWYRLKWYIWRIFHKSTLPTDPTQAIIDLLPTIVMMGVLMGFAAHLRELNRLPDLEREIQKTAFVLKPNWMWK